VYRASATPQDGFQLGWFDRSGSGVTPLTPRLGVALNPALSPDDQRVAFFMGQIQLLDLADGRLSQFTFDLPAIDFAAVWSGNGSEIIFSSTRKGRHDLYKKHASGAGGDRPLLVTSEDKIPTDLSDDGKFLLYRNMDANHNFDIRALSLADNRQFTVLATEHDQRNAKLSPDKKWVAYQSNESGRFEIWVRPFRPQGTDGESDEKWRVTADGGIQVRWRRDGGRELFYVGLDGRLMAVPFVETEKGRAIRFGTAEALNAPLIPLLYSGGTSLPPYAVTRNGQRFLMTMVPVAPSATPITVLSNWREAR
jgi:serine/threonine-protein kinase